MFSNEIDKLVKEHGYNLPCSVYLTLSPTTSPQITRIKYNPFSNQFEIWTDDGYYWKFSVWRD